MKKLLFVGLFFLIVPLVTQGATFERNLFYGISNDIEVTKLQEFLTSEGVYTGPITGNFFSLTLQGVKNFQAREDIEPVAGYFGPLTRFKANEFIFVDIEALEQQAIAETGTAPVLPERKSNIDDIVISLSTQIALLVRQIELLQAQLNETKIIQGQIAQIQENTAPVPEPEPALVVEPEPIVEAPPPPKMIALYSSGRTNTLRNTITKTVGDESPYGFSSEELVYGGYEITETGYIPIRIQANRTLKVFEDVSVFMVNASTLPEIDVVAESTYELDYLKLGYNLYPLRGAIKENGIYTYNFDRGELGSLESGEIVISGRLQNVDEEINLIEFPTNPVILTITINSVGDTWKCAEKYSEGCEMRPFPIVSTITLLP
ncbi:hypothetical protein LCGC14_1824410 [marine sediment metagenome]|uniref:Peptidoglycan binding-like domain-containing protein n=1 Tax=marine sediment metagenome TaxID=412755 RepID=A0A0F9IXP5_9ZZZZ